MSERCPARNGDRLCLYGADIYSHPADFHQDADGNRWPTETARHRMSSVLVAWDDRLTDEDAGRHIRNAIGLARKQAGIPDGEGRVTIHVTITEGPRAR